MDMIYGIERKYLISAHHLFFFIILSLHDNAISMNTTLCCCGQLRVMICFYVNHRPTLAVQYNPYQHADFRNQILQGMYPPAMCVSEYSGHYFNFYSSELNPHNCLVFFFLLQKFQNIMYQNHINFIAVFVLNLIFNFKQ